jgi:hypothetical protein
MFHFAVNTDDLLADAYQPIVDISDRQELCSTAFERPLASVCPAYSAYPPSLYSRQLLQVFF